MNTKLYFSNTECAYAVTNSGLEITVNTQELIDQTMNFKCEFTQDERGKREYFHTILDLIPDSYIEEYLDVDVMARVHKN